MNKAKLIKRFKEVRDFSLEISSFLSDEDHQIQSMENASPVKWHLAHTTWFFETLILVAFDDSYKLFNAMMNSLYNSYYNSLGKLFPRSKRGLVTKPTLKEIIRYRKYVDEKALAFFEKTPLEGRLKYLLLLGLNHEQQHQELMLTDIKHGLFFNPLYPSLNISAVKVPEEQKPPNRQSSNRQSSGWLSVDEGVYHVGAEPDEDFYYDNEGPKHKVYLNSFKIADQVVTNGEYLAFMEKGGYDDALLWLSEGWDYLKKTKRKHPLYWVKQDNEWHQYTLSGLKKINPSDCLSHVNYYEASAYANWLGCRLPTEAEWEVAAKKTLSGDDPSDLEGNFAEKKTWQPHLEDSFQFFGNAWEWTSSAYSPYPGFKAEAGAVGEYNGKFMCNQYVLKGGSCATPKSHIRASYRNFFSAPSEWQFTSIRLCKVE